MPLVTINPTTPSLKTLPGFEIGYDQITSSVNITATVEATPTTIISCAAHTFDGSPVLCEFNAYGVTNPTNGAAFFALWEGATEITRLGVISVAIGTSTLQVVVPVSLQYRFTPTAGSHTYTVAAWAGSTTGTPNVSAGGGGVGNAPPAFARFTKV